MFHWGTSGVRCRFSDTNSNYPAFNHTLKPPVTTASSKNWKRRRSSARLCTGGLRMPSRIRALRNQNERISEFVRFGVRKKDSANLGAFESESNSWRCFVTYRDTAARLRFSDCRSKLLIIAEFLQSHRDDVPVVHSKHRRTNFACKGSHGNKCLVAV